MSIRERFVIDHRDDFRTEEETSATVNFTPASPEAIQSAREEVEKIRLRNLRGEVA